MAFEQEDNSKILFCMHCIQVRHNKSNRAEYVFVLITNKMNEISILNESTNNLLYILFAFKSHSIQKKMATNC